MLRKAAVAGTWYSKDPRRLTSDVEKYLAAAGAVAAPEGELVALVSPHAGLVYSGPVAAHGYQLLRHRQFDLIVLVGPSHYVAFEGVSVWAHNGFESPLATLKIDEQVAAELMRRCPLVRELPVAHEREHSLEMQLPFLGLVAPNTRILPLVMGHQTRETAFALGDALAALATDRRVLFIASSDLTHFLDARTAATLDARVLSHVEAIDPDSLMSTLEHRPDHACGGGPMVSVLRAAVARGANKSDVLRYADSGDVSGDKSSVVGYMSAALWRTE